jgi:hypothetical protein
MNLDYGAKGETRTLTGYPHWNLNPARLPIPPLSHEIIWLSQFGTVRNCSNLICDINVYILQYIKSLMQALCRKNHIINAGVNDGARTHDHRNHNPGLYQLSYAHHKTLVRPAGLEPATPGLEGRCSIRLSYRRKSYMYYKIMVGAEGFEPPTTCSQSRCATRLRYTPNTGRIITP